MDRYALGWLDAEKKFKNSPEYRLGLAILNELDERYQQHEEESD